MLRLPHKTSRGPNGDQARATIFQKDKVLRLPRKSSSRERERETKCCAWHASAAGAHAATKRAPATPRESKCCACHAKVAVQMNQSAAPATQVQPGPTRRPSTRGTGIFLERSKCCACHAKVAPKRETKCCACHAKVAPDAVKSAAPATQMQPGPTRRPSARRRSSRETKCCACHAKVAPESHKCCAYHASAAGAHRRPKALPRSSRETKQSRPATQK